MRHHPEHAHLSWRFDEPPKDGSPVIIRGQDFPHRPGYFLSCEARWKETPVTHPFVGSIQSWATDDGKYNWHAHAWAKVEP